MLYLSKLDNKEKLEVISGSTVKERLNRLGSFLNGLPNIYTGQDINSQIDRLRLDKKVFQENNQVLYLETENILSGILTLFVQAKYNFPRSDQILYCRMNSSLRELKSFIYRCFQDKNKQLYILVNCEQLSYENQQEFTKYFQLLINEAHNPDFRFGLLSSSSKSQIVDFFRFHKELSFIRIKEINMIGNNEIKSIIKIGDRTSKVISSVEAGFGKSAKVENQAKNENKRFYSFPIAGELSISSICKRLCRIDFIGPSILLFQINCNNNQSLVNEILMNLSLFKTIISDNKIFIIPQNVELYVEVANSYDNSLYKELKYLEYLPQEIIQKFDISRIYPSDRLESSMNYVCNYLKLYKNDQLNVKEISFERLQNIELLSSREISELLAYAIAETGGTIQNFILLNTFVEVLGTMLKCFENSPFFSCDIIEFYKADYTANNLSFLVPELSVLRSTVFKALLESTKEFTTKSITNVSRNQANANKGQILDSESEFILNNDCNVTWEQSNHFVMVFARDGGILYIYRDRQKVPINIKKLIYTQTNVTIDANNLAAAIKANNYNIDDFSTYSHFDFLGKLNAYSTTDLQVDLAKDPYVLTPDNFLKMNLIYVRAEAKIPIVIMGETGVGKTSLLRFFVNKVLGESLEIFSIHAGVTLNQIFEKMKKITKDCDRFRRIWVFFDEFNTNENIGLLCEIMCQRSMNNEKLPDNLVFAAACNPYRLRSKKIQFDQNVGIRKKRTDFSESNRLLHIVKPLPDTIIQYIWDFGSLTSSDFLKYLQNMLQQTNSIHNSLFAELIVSAHMRVKQKEDTSSVSLRDVTRFIRLFTWFKKSRHDRSKLERSDLYKENVKNFELKVECEIQDSELVAGILAYCHCYYLRISSDSERAEFLNQISVISAGRVSAENIEDILRTEQNDYFARMELKQGTALNKALRENVFAIIPCILEKIPIFICGKPGCSKSLSISLVFTNLRGKKSIDNYYKGLPELIPVSYQGSESCTSEGIIKIFERAEKFLDTTETTELLPVIVFDEIGLAEISKHNPLKVLHSLLEFENTRVGFVALSN